MHGGVDFRKRSKPGRGFVVVFSLCIDMVSFGKCPAAYLEYGHICIYEYRVYSVGGVFAGEDAG